MRVLQSITCVIDQFSRSLNIPLRFSVDPSISSCDDVRPNYFNFDFGIETGSSLPSKGDWTSHAMSSVSGVLGVELFLTAEVTTGNIIMIEQLGGPIYETSLVLPYFNMLRANLRTELMATNQMKYADSVDHMLLNSRYKRLFVFNNSIAFNISQTPEFGINQTLIGTLRNEKCVFELAGMNSNMLSLDGMIRMHTDESDYVFVSG